MTNEAINRPRPRHALRDILRHGLPIGMAAALMVGDLAPARAAGDKPDAQAAPAPTLPSGANALQEVFQDWQVACAPQGAGPRCALSQQQSDPQSKQRVLLITLNASGADKAEGVLILPFGLAIDSGATLQVDDGTALPPLRFRTCLPAGCIIPLNFDAKLIGALRKGGALKVKVVAADTAKEMVLPISLKGFPGALDRTVALSR